ncbi:hypothetical protein [Bacillus thuringiensis]|uniref:hypothetical protein n=1 Tax=Bacillus thuringiensis TaxID=1428 RepID=UPI000A78C367|nr:hypothetical protein [Bacillus thuringiensis]
MSLKEALKLGYPEEIKEKDGLLHYKDKPIYESSVMNYLDENTAKEVEKQLTDTTGIYRDVNHLYDVKLTPKMNFTIKLASLYDGGEKNDVKNGPIGHWYYTYNVGGRNTGKHQYRSAHPSANVVLSSEAKSKLDKNTIYYLSMYLKADSDTEPTIEVNGENSTITSKKVKLNNKGYQRVDILVQNSERNPIKQIHARGNNTTNVYWDDVSITKILAMNPKNLTDEEIKEKYKNFSESISWDGEWFNSVTFKNIKPLENYVKQYRVVCERGILDSFNIVKDSDPVNEDGSVTVDMMKYTDGFRPI